MYKNQDQQILAEKYNRLIEITSLKNAPGKIGGPEITSLKNAPRKIGGGAVKDVVVVIDIILRECLPMLLNAQRHIEHEGERAIDMDAFKKGIIEICNKFGIDYNQLDVDRLL